MDSAVFLPTSCALCPRHCAVNRAAGKRGSCGADDTLRIARAALHEWEEPPLSVGAGSGAVFFSGCPLRCLYCQNSDISLGNRGRVITVERLADIFLELADQGAANINLVTPTQYVPQIKLALEQAWKRGLNLPIIYNTSGYECVETIDTLAGYIDVYLTDFKYWKSSESDAAAKYSHAPDYYDKALAALDEMMHQVGRPRFAATDKGEKMVAGIIVRHLLLPDRLSDSKQVMGMLWEHCGDRVLYSLMSQYTPMRSFLQAPELDFPVEPGAYEALLDYLDGLGCDTYFWQDGDAAEESFIPPFDWTGVDPAPR